MSTPRTQRVEGCPEVALGRPRPGSWNRSGATLAELLVVAWLFALVLAATAAFAGAHGRLVAVSQDKVRAADVARTVDLILNGELRYAGRGDVIPGPDSVRLRAVRGSATICATGTEMMVRYDGTRRPDPAKDSALLITASGTVGSIHAVVAAGATSATDPCGDLRLRLDPVASTREGHLLIFETGAYHLSSGALRYRRGRGGRQPVTEAVLASARIDTARGTLRARTTLLPHAFPRLGPAAMGLTTVVRRMNTLGLP